jgi:chromosome transmission fidelity protein 4
MACEPYSTSCTRYALKPRSVGSYAYSGGGDTLVRIWRVAHGADQDPPMAFEATESITSVVATVRSVFARFECASLTCSRQNEWWLSASEDGEVRRYRAGRVDMDGLVTSVPGTAVRSLAVDVKGKKVAVASEYAYLASHVDYLLKMAVAN